METLEKRVETLENQVAALNYLSTQALAAWQKLQQRKLYRFVKLVIRPDGD